MTTNKHESTQTYFSQLCVLGKLRSQSKLCCGNLPSSTGGMAAEASFKLTKFVSRWLRAGAELFGVDGLESFGYCEWSLVVSE